MMKRKRRNDHVKLALLIIGIYLILQSAYIYMLTDSIRSEISPGRFNLSLAYAFMTFTAGISFLGYFKFYRKG